MSSPTSQPVVRRYAASEDRAPLRRFWYDTYVREMRRDLDRADHEKRELPDPRDRTGLIIAALEEERVVGTIICTPCWRGTIGQYTELYRLNELDEDYVRHTGIITKLMVAPEHRASSLSLRLSTALYRHGVPMGMDQVIIDCNDYLVPFFTKLGFRKWIDPVEHPAYGRVHVLKFDCFDLDHLRRVGSPLIKIAREIAPTYMGSGAVEAQANHNNAVISGVPA